MSSNSWQNMTAVFLIGMGVGAGLGVLFAPKSGDETRDQIAGAVKGGVDQFVAQGAKIGRRAQQSIDDAKEQVKKATDAGQQAYEQAKGASA